MTSKQILRRSNDVNPKLATLTSSRQKLTNQNLLGHYDITFSQSSADTISMTSLSANHNLSPRRRSSGRLSFLSPLLWAVGPRSSSRTHLRRVFLIFNCTSFSLLINFPFPTLAFSHNFLTLFHHTFSEALSLHCL